MDSVAPLPIFLVINRQCHRGGGCESGCIAGQREQRLALPKTDVTHPELDCSGGDAGRRAGIFPNP